MTHTIISYASIGLSVFAIGLSLHSDYQIRKTMRRLKELREDH